MATNPWANYTDQQFRDAIAAQKAIIAAAGTKGQPGQVGDPHYVLESLIYGYHKQFPNHAPLKD